MHATLQMSQPPVARGLESVTEELEQLSVAAGEDGAPAAAAPAPEPKLLKSQFQLFAKFGDTAADGKTIKVSSKAEAFSLAALVDLVPIIRFSRFVTITFLRNYCSMPKSSMRFVLCMLSMTSSVHALSTVLQLNSRPRL